MYPASGRYLAGREEAVIDNGRGPRGPLFHGWWIVAAGFEPESLIGVLMFHAYGACAVLLRQKFGWSKTILSTAFAM